MRKLTIVAAGAFILWGILHIIGGSAILVSAWSNPDAGFANYRGATNGYDALSGDILGYFAYGLAALGIASVMISFKGNLKNDETALMANTLIIVLTEIGLIVFLLSPGHLSFAEASPGLVLGSIAIIAGGMACNGAEAHHANT